MRGGRGHGARRSGFTLIEVLIALGILALVLTAIYSSWTAILRASKTGLDAAASVQRARMAYKSIEDALTCAQCLQWDTNYWFIAEGGTEAMLTFTSHLPESFPRGGKWPGQNVRRVQFSVEQGPNSSGQLVLRQRPVLLDTTDEFDSVEMSTPLVLAKYVKEFVVEFRDQRGEWGDEWKDPRLLPTAVRFSLTFDDAPNPRRYSSQRTEETVVRYAKISSMPIPMQAWGVNPNQPINPNLGAGTNTLNQPGRMTPPLTR